MTPVQTEEALGEQYVGDETVNAEDHTTICGEEEPAYMRSKTEYAQREKERER